MATLPMGRRPACNSTSAFLSSMSTSPPIFSRRISLERVRILNPPAAFSTRKSPGSIFISPGSEPICRLVREELKRTSLPTLVRLTSLKKSPSSDAEIQDVSGTVSLDGDFHIGQADVIEEIAIERNGAAHILDLGVAGAARE